MSDYVVPQVRVFQQFSSLPNSVTQSMHAFVFGPSYTLYRYSNAATKPLAFLYDYVGIQNPNLDWPQGYDSSIDLTYAKLYADNAIVRYSNEEPSYAKGTLTFLAIPTADDEVVVGAITYVFKATVGATANQVKIGATLADSKANLIAAINRDGAGAGILYGSATVANADATATSSSTYVILLTAVASGEAGNTVATTSDNELAVLPAAATLLGGEAGAAHIIVTSDRSTDLLSFTASEDLSRTSDVSGIANAGGAKVGDIVAWGSVGSMTFATVTAIAYSSGVYKRVTLDRDAPTDGTTVFLARTFNGILVPAGATSYVIDTGHNKIDVKGTMVIPFPTGADAAITAKILQATLYMEYRVRNYANASDIGSISDIADVETDLGADIHPDDPLTFAVYMALKNGGERVIYYTATDGSVSEWSSILSMIRTQMSMYALAPVSTDAAVRELIKTHVSSTSQASAKRWRIGFFGSAVPSETEMFTADDVSANYVPGTLTFSAVQYVVDTTAINCHTMKVGDKVYFNYDGDVPAASATIASITSNTSFTVSNPTAAILDESAGRIGLFRSNDADDEADEIAATSLAAHSSRMYHVFAGKLPPVTTPSGESVSVGNEFAAATVAGLCCSVPPQQGLTNIEVLGFGNLSSMYRRYSQENLDTMAAAGTLIVTQDYAGGPVYVRHQLSTARVDNNLNTSELSLIKNMDSISYYFADMFKDMIGVTNITPDTLNVVKLRLQDGLDYLASNTAVGTIGPQLNTENTKINSVEVDGVLKDNINADVDLDLPKPFNVFNLILRAV